MSAAARLLAGLLAASDALARAGIAALLAVVAWTVASRALLRATGLDWTLPGAIELAGHALMVAVLAALPRAAVAGMVRVEVLAARLPDVAARALDRLWTLAFALFGATLAVLLADEAALRLARGDATQDLALPLGLVTGYAAAAAGVLALTALLHALRPGAR